MIGFCNDPLYLLLPTPAGMYNADVEVAMSMSAQEIIRELRTGGERADVTLSKVCTRLPSSRRWLRDFTWKILL